MPKSPDKLWHLFSQEHLHSCEENRALPVPLPLLISGSEHRQDRQAEEGSSFTPTVQMNWRGNK